MELARRAAAPTAGVDDGYGLPHPSTTHGQMTVDALRLELLKESIRQEFIVAELAKQRELGSGVRGDRGLEHNAGPLAHTELQPTTLPHHDTSPVQQDGQLQHVPLSQELCLHDALMTRGAAHVLKRRPAKERIEEWYQPPWRDRSRDEDDASLIRIFKRLSAKERIVKWYKPPRHDRSGNEDNASLIQVRWSQKAFSGVKRKRTSEFSAPNKKRSYKQWTCALCHMNTSSELSFKEHCAGKHHMSECTKGMAGLKKIETAERHNPWNCSICDVKCSGELDLENHLKGRRHQEKVECLRGENKEIEGNNGFHEAGPYEKKVPQLADKNNRHASSWNCSICKTSCTSKSDLDSHLRGRRHQQNVNAQFVGENNTVLASFAGGKQQQAVAVASA